jgi:hypothetical protein
MMIKSRMIRWVGHAHVGKKKFITNFAWKFQRKITAWRIWAI